ncbi:Tas retrotransposon peptidase A16, partial [Ostertagia ostertagi]
MMKLSDRSERRSPQPVQYPGNQARIELERRIAEIRAYLNENRAVPERCIRQIIAEPRECTTGASTIEQYLSRRVDSEHQKSFTEDDQGKQGMAASLKARKGVLTRHSNTLSQSLSKHSTLGNAVNLEDSEACRVALAGIRVAEVEIRTLLSTFEKALFEFTEAVDGLVEPPTKEEEEKISEYISNAESMIVEVTNLLVKFEINKNQILSHKLEVSGVDHQIHGGSTAARVELPKIPLPQFSGKSWQWDSFWELFDATVHSSQLSDLQKFNYLLKALKGEARESIARFQVSSANYYLAVAHLKERYGNVQSIITNLHSQLEHWSARSTQLKDQRKLHDQLSAITAQLVSKGECLDSPWLLSKILSKFTVAIQRNALKEKVSLPQNECWTLTKLLTTLDKVIKQEEEIEKHIPRKQENTQFPKKEMFRPQPQMKKRTPFCFYCESKEHWSTNCTKIVSPRARLEYLKKANRCIGCGSKTHSFTECKTKGCMHCGKKHHASTCFKGDAPSPSSPVPSPDRKREQKQKSAHVRQNLTLCDETESLAEEEGTPDLTVMRVEDSSCKTHQGEVFLLTGSLRALHPTTQKLVTLQILLDTGADRSFIDTRLAKELQLPSHGVVTMKLRTFGAKTAKEIQCIDTRLSVWDSEGEQLKLRLYTHDNLKRNFTGGKLLEEDLRYIREKGIKLSTPSTGILKPPEILIGCDQLWNFIKFGAPHFTMPSGLILVPTRIGYMVSGERIQSRENDELHLHSSVHSIESQGDGDPWESHWSIQTQGKRGPYVTNRVREVRGIVQSLVDMGVEMEFGYIDTKWNPADIGTRGASTQELSSHLWWEGYPLENITNNGFVSGIFSLPNEKDEEEQADDPLLPVQINATKTDQFPDTGHSRFGEIQQILAYVLRFLKGIASHVQDPLREKIRRVLPCIDTPNEGQRLTASDIRDAHDVMIRNHQAVHLGSQYRRELSKTINIKEDEKHLMRAYG